MAAGQLYPDIVPYKTGMMDTGDGHSVYWEMSGDPQGIPVLFLHGGPGSGSNPHWRKLFDPQKYNIILFDQRGSGKSKPHADLSNNTTQHLVRDIEQLRQLLGIDKWAVFGGSWGSTLALAYADLHPPAVSALVMYGIFLCRDSELKDLYFEGGMASRVFPEVFAPFIELLPEHKRSNPIEGYKELFESKDPKIRRQAIDMWTRLEKKVSKLVVTEQELQAQMADPDFVISHSLIENHYFQNNGFIDGGKILKTIGAKVKDIPVHIVQGRYDMVCPFITAWELHKAIPGSRMHILEDVGHTARDPKVSAELVSIMDELHIDAAGQKSQLKAANSQKPKNGVK